MYRTWLGLSAVPMAFAAFVSITTRDPYAICFASVLVIFLYAALGGINAWIAGQGCTCSEDGYAFCVCTDSEDNS